jgi:tetratricopeptide (TPR) repeat protein
MELSEFQLELAWRTCRWDDADPKLAALLAGRARPSFHQAVLQCLRGLRSADHALFQNALDGARLQLLDELSVSSLENTKSAQPTLFRLQVFREIERSWIISVADREDTNRALLLDKEWREQNAQLGRTPFESFEQCLALRVSLCSAIGVTELIPSSLLQLTRAARKSGRLNTALASLHRLKELQPDSVGSMLVEAKVLWACGERDQAIVLGKKVIAMLEVSPPASGSQSLLGKALFLCGRWLIETGNESAGTIRTSYLKAALVRFKPEKGVNDKISKVSFVLGKHADALFAATAAKLESPEWKASVEVRLHRQNELAGLEKLLSDGRGQPGTVAEVQKHVRKLRAQVKEDEHEHSKLERDQMEFLIDATRFYVQALASGDKCDLAVFGLCNLWFGSGASGKAVGEYVAKKLQLIPSAKWLPLAYQIASRLSMGVELEAGDTIAELVFKLAK